MMSINQHEGREGAVYARALAELLVGKGLVGQEELETMMAQVRHEFEALISPRVRREVDRLGIRLVRYQDL